MKYFSIFLFILILSQNEANTMNNVNNRNADDFFDINIGAGYGFGNGQTSSSLPRSTTKIKHSTSHLSKLLGDDLTLNQDNRANVQVFPTPETLEAQESVNTFVTEKPYFSSWKTDDQTNPYRVKEIMNMKDIQKVLHNLDTKTEYSKVLQVLKVPAIYEIHLEKLQRNNAPDHKQKEFLKTTSKNVSRTNNRLKKQNVKTDDIIYGKAMTSFTDFANIDDWLHKSSGNSQVEDNESAKVGKLTFQSRPSKSDWAPSIESEISESSYAQRQRQKPSKNSPYHSQITEMNSKLPLVYSPEHSVRHKTNNANLPTASNPVFESSRNVYKVSPSYQPQAMYEVAPPALGKKPIYRNQQGPRPVVTSYSTLSPVLPYDLKTSHGAKFFRNTQRSEINIEDVSNSNQDADQYERQTASSSNGMNIPVEPFHNRGSGRLSLHMNCRGRFGLHEVSNQEIRASSRLDNIYLTTDRPVRRSFSFASRDSKYTIPDIFRSMSINRRSGKPLKYVLYMKEKYSDEDDRK